MDNLLEEKEVSLKSHKKWLWVGIVIALLNPIFSGLVIGIAFWTEPKFKKEAKIILAVTIIWGIILIYLSNWLTTQGFLPI